MTIFDFLKSIFTEKKSWEEFSESDRKLFSPYMVNRWISMNMEFTAIANYLQQLNIQFMKPKQAYTLWKDLTPKMKFWSKYINGSKKEKESNGDLIKFISQQEKWSIHETTENIRVLQLQSNYKEMIYEYLQKFGFNEKEIKKKFKV